jgi:very-short-patch-repair endonuclease
VSGERSSRASDTPTTRHSSAPLSTGGEVRDEDGRFLARVDLGCPQWRIALEYAGDHHRERTQVRRDIARVNALRQSGWLVLRFTADDVLRHPHVLVEQVLCAIRERR